MAAVVLCPGSALAGAVRVGGTVKFCSTVRLTVVVAVRLPDVPVIVTVVVPGTAAALAAIVSTLVVLVGVGLNTADTPVGKVEVVRLTLPLKPPTSVTVIVLLPVVPCGIGASDEADSVKLGPAATVRETVVVAVELPEVPVIVIVVVPTAAAPLAVSERTLVNVVGFVPKVAVTPVGTFEAARVTLPVKPFKSVTVIVLFPAAPP
jgi:hypothetical protein